MFTPLRLTITTGDNVSALERNMEKYRKNGDDVQGAVPGELLATSIRSMLLNVGLKHHSIPMNDVLDRCMYYLRMPDGTKAGAWFQDGMQEFQCDARKVKNKQNPTKSEVEVIAGYQCISYIEALKEEFSEFVLNGETLDSAKLQKFSWKRMLAFKMNTKVEALIVQDDADRLRMFFPSHVCKFIFDNVLWKNMVQKIYQKGAVMLGFRWLDGGSQKLFNRYSKFRKILAWDISGLDSSMKAKIIQLIFEALFHAFDPNSVGDQSQRMFVLLYILCVGHYVSKVVAWVDAFRIMVGSMASGELMTSIFNTLYCIVAVFSWLHFIADIKFGAVSSKPKIDWLIVNVIEAVLLIFGDDGFMATDAEEVNLLDDVVVGEKQYPSLDTFLKKYWKMSVKRSDSVQTSSLLSVPDEVGDLPPGAATILKRGFVEVDYKGSKVVGPWKSTSLSVGKLLKHEVPVTKDGDVAYCAYLMMCRAVGHAVDTAGVNRYMYDICQYTYDAAFATFTNVLGYGGRGLEPGEMTAMEEKIIGEMVIRFTGGAARSQKSYDVVRFPSWEELQDMFLPIRDYVEPPTDSHYVRRQKHINFEMYGFDY